MLPWPASSTGARIQMFRTLNISHHRHHHPSLLPGSNVSHGIHFRPPAQGFKYELQFAFGQQKRHWSADSVRCSRRKDSNTNYRSFFHHPPAQVFKRVIYDAFGRPSSPPSPCISLHSPENPPPERPHTALSRCRQG